MTIKEYIELKDRCKGASVNTITILLMRESDANLKALAGMYQCRPDRAEIAQHLNQ